MTNSTLETGKMNYAKFTAQYLGTYIFGLIIVTLITSIFQFDAGPAMGIILVMVALSIPVNAFVKDHNRVFSTGERILFASVVAVVTLIAAFAFAYILSQLEIAAGGVNMLQAQLNEVFGSAPSVPLALTILVGAPFLLSWVVAYTAIWFFARGALKNQLKASQKA